MPCWLSNFQYTQLMVNGSLQRCSFQPSQMTKIDVRRRLSAMRMSSPPKAKCDINTSPLTVKPTRSNSIKRLIYSVFSRNQMWHSCEMGEYFRSSARFRRCAGFRKSFFFCEFNFFDSILQMGAWLEVILARVRVFGSMISTRRNGKWTSVDDWIGSIKVAGRPYMEPIRHHAIFYI